MNERTEEQEEEQFYFTGPLFIAGTWGGGRWWQRQGLTKISVLGGEGGGGSGHVGVTSKS